MRGKEKKGEGGVEGRGLGIRKTEKKGLKMAVKEGQERENEGDEG